MSENWQDTLKEGRFGNLVGWLHLPEIAAVQIDEKYVILEKQIHGGACKGVTHILCDRILESKQWADKTVDEILGLIQEVFPEHDTSDDADLGGATYFGHMSLRDAIEDLLSGEDDEDDEEYDEDNEFDMLLKELEDEAEQALAGREAFFENAKKQAPEISSHSGLTEGGSVDTSEDEEEDDEQDRKRSEGCVLIELMDRDILGEADIKAIEFLIANQKDCMANALDALAEEYQWVAADLFEQSDEDPRVYNLFPEEATGEDLVGRVTCDSISIVQHPHGELSYTEFAFRMVWDDEHMANVLMHGGRVVGACDSGGAVEDPELPKSEGPQINPFTGKPIEFKKK